MFIQSLTSLALNFGLCDCSDFGGANWLVVILLRDVFWIMLVLLDENVFMILSLIHSCWIRLPLTISWMEGSASILRSGVLEDRRIVYRILKLIWIRFYLLNVLLYLPPFVFSLKVFPLLEYTVLCGSGDCTSSHF